VSGESDNERPRRPSFDRLELHRPRVPTLRRNLLLLIALLALWFYLSSL